MAFFGSPFWPNNFGYGGFGGFGAPLAPAPVIAAPVPYPVIVRKEIIREIVPVKILKKKCDPCTGKRYYVQA
jgi:hypothetical protein